MLKIFIHENQLYNFLIEKEPIQLINDVMDTKHFEYYVDIDKVIFTEYPTYITVELKTRKKALKAFWRKLWKKNKKSNKRR